MVLINGKENCCGCGACVEICPRQCISLKYDSEGFLYPEMSEEKCVQCMQCKEVCPVVKSQTQNDNVEGCYVAYALDNDIRLQSSSGGIFSLLAEEILHRAGIVIGAAYDESLMVHHIVIDSNDQLEQLRGSKYVQSNTDHTYVQTRQALLNGKYVLYSGTPCQIAGLKAFLGKLKENKKLFTVDVLCHGVPSPKLWKHYLIDQAEKYNSPVQKVNFRQKKNGWKLYNMELEFDNLEKYEKAFFQDSYIRMFLKNISLRPSCYQCKFKNLERVSDLTIGDCWGIEKTIPNMDDDKGTSVVLIHSAHGRELFNVISKRMVFCEAYVECILPKTSDSRKSVVPHEKRTAFFKSLKKEASIEELSKYLQPSRVQKVKWDIMEFLLKIRTSLRGIMKKNER